MPVAVGAGDQINPVLSPDGAGGAIVAWESSGGGSAAVRVLHLTRYGACAPGWLPEGILLSGARDPFLSSDGADGAFLGWTISPVIAYRHMAGGAPFLAEEASAATPGSIGLPLDFAGGPPVSPEKAPHNALPMVLPDGAGGTLVGWKHFHLIADKLEFERLDANWVPVSGAIWVDQSFSMRNNNDPSMCADGSAGAILAWSDWTVDGGDIHAMRVRSDDTFAPGWLTPIAVCTEPGAQSATGMVPDGAGGAIVVWRDARNGQFEQVYAQRITRDGAIAAGWPAGGRAICTYACDSGLERFSGFSTERSSPVVGDGAGGAFIVWSDARADAGDVYCQHLLPDASLAPGWPENGLALGSALGLQSRPAIAADGKGGAIACWEDARSGERDIYAQRVTGAGALATGWPAGALAVCTAPGDQITPRIVSDGASGAILAWQDGRNGSADIYAAHVTGDGAVPALTSLVQAEGRPGLARLVWFTPDPLHLRATVERREPESDWSPVAPGIPDGTGSIVFEDRDVVAGHRYGYRLRVVDAGVERSEGEVWLSIADSPRLELGAPYPNPAPGAVNVPCALGAGESGVLELVDLSGRVVERRAIEAGSGGSRVIPFASSGRLSPGLYFVRLRQAGRSLIARIALAR
ncbi:MAG TPA: T9SS type A sorting domain-containing protein [Candidatus Eisenbacteria bacterium]